MLFFSDNESSVFFSDVMFVMTFFVLTWWSILSCARDVIISSSQDRQPRPCAEEQEHVDGVPAQSRLTQAETASCLAATDDVSVRHSRRPLARPSFLTGAVKLSLVVLWTASLTGYEAQGDSTDTRWCCRRCCHLSLSWDNRVIWCHDNDKKYLLITRDMCKFVAP